MTGETQPGRCTNPGQPPAGQSSRTKYLLLFTSRADSHRSAGPVLRSLLRGAAGSSARGAGGGRGHRRQVTAIRRLGRLSAPLPALPARRSSLRGGPSPPALRAGHRDPRPPPRGAGRPCPPRAAPPGHGQPLSTRAAASHLSPREAAGAAPGCPSSCGPGGPPVTPAPSLARTPSCRGYSIVTAAARRRGGGGRSSAHFRPAGAALGAAGAAGGKWCAPPASASGPAAAMAGYLTPRFRRIRSQSELQPRRGSGRRRGGRRASSSSLRCSSFSPAEPEGSGAERAARGRRLPIVAPRLPVPREGAAGRTGLGRLGSWTAGRGASSGRTPAAQLTGDAAVRAGLRVSPGGRRG